jgi:hypothetical protein
VHLCVADLGRAFLLGIKYPILHAKIGPTLSYWFQGPKARGAAADRSSGRSPAAAAGRAPSAHTYDNYRRWDSFACASESDSASEGEAEPRTRGNATPAASVGPAAAQTAGATSAPPSSTSALPPPRRSWASTASSSHSASAGITPATRSVAAAALDADGWRSQGNERFKKGDFKGAEVRQSSRLEVLK